MVRKKPFPRSLPGSCIRDKTGCECAREMYPEGKGSRVGLHWNITLPDGVGGPPACMLEPGILPRGGFKSGDGPSCSAVTPGGKMPPSTAGETPAATFFRRSARYPARL